MPALSWLGLRGYTWRRLARDGTLVPATAFSDNS